MNTTTPRFYNLPGEGIIVAITQGDETVLYNRQGLQYRIIECKNQGLNCAQEEQALAQINNITTPHGL